MGFSCIVMRALDSIGFCVNNEKGFFCTVVGLCAIEAKVDADELELKVVIVLVISRRSRLEGRSALRLACCDGVRLVCCVEARLATGKLACGDATKLEWLPLRSAKLGATTKLAR